MAGDERPACRSCGLTRAGLRPGLPAGGEPIGPDDDYGTLAARLETLGGELLVRALDERPPFAEQDEARVTYAHKIEAARPRARPARRPTRSSAPCARCARTSARGCRCRTAASSA
jgi:methionyl-tRNA formyltransferase